MSGKRPLKAQRGSLFSPRGGNSPDRPALVLALFLDWALGEPPNAFHPVAWLGRWLAWLEARLRPRGGDSPPRQILAGALALMAGIAPALLLADLLERRGSRFKGLALKQALAYRALDGAVSQVEEALRVGDLERARHRLAYHLVSRDTRRLNPEEVAMAAVESLAENLSDSLVGPLFWWAAGGLPAAWLYRVINTADAMWGYRTPRYLWFGKAAARLDDLLGWLPARITAGLICLAAWRHGDGRRAWQVWRTQAHRTPSPNAGHPMAAMAGALGVTLAKPGVYALEGGLDTCRVAHVAQARRLGRWVAALAWSLAWLWAVAFHATPGDTAHHGSGLPDAPEPQG